MEHASSNVLVSQNFLLKNLTAEAIHTSYGKKYNFAKIKNRQSFVQEVPLVKYQDIVSDIGTMMDGKSDVLWPGQIKYFAKSSGTTNQRSKFIPVSNAFLRSNLIRSGWDTTAYIYQMDPDARIFQHKSLIMGGSLHAYPSNNNIFVGDVSAIMISTIPPIGRPFYTPDFGTALLDNWEEKIDLISKKCINEKVVMFGGVPTWNIVLFNRILEITGKDNIQEIWPELRYYLHGGVNFQPYRNLFKKYLPNDNFHYIEAYNASEGFFGVQDKFSSEGMRLLIDNGIYYEFIKVQDIQSPNASSLTMDINEVEVGQNYAIIITTCSGLWRYIIGDTIKFTTLRTL